MRPFVGKLLLTMLTVPLAGIVLRIAAYATSRAPHSGDELLAIVVSAMSVLLPIGCWVLIWRRMVCWSRARVQATALIGAESIVFLVAALNLESAAWTAFLTTIPFQLVMVWRPSRREHAAMLAPWRRNPQSHCPCCMTALAVAAGDGPNCTPAAADDVPTEEPQ